MGGLGPYPRRPATVRYPRSTLPLVVVSSEANGLYISAILSPHFRFLYAGRDKNYGHGVVRRAETGEPPRRQACSDRACRLQCCCQDVVSTLLTLTVMRHGPLTAVGRRCGASMALTNTRCFAHMKRTHSHERREDHHKVESSWSRPLRTGLYSRRPCAIVALLQKSTFSRHGNCGRGNSGMSVRVRLTCHGSGELLEVQLIVAVRVDRLHELEDDFLPCCHPFEV